MTLDEQLENEILGVGILNNALNSYNDADVHERADILNLTAQLIGGRDHFADAYKELEVSDTAYASKTGQAMNSRVNNIKDQYETYKDIIVSEVAAKFDSILASENDPVNALKKIVEAFKPLLKIRTPTQAMADGIKTRELSNILRMPIMTQVRGDVTEAKDILYRTAVAEYLDLGRNNKYSVNTDKLGELMKDPVAGSTLYTYAKNA